MTQKQSSLAEKSILNMFLGLTQKTQKNAEAHLLPLVLASGMYAFGAADQLRAFAMQPILRKSAVSACPQNASREKQFKFSLNSVDKMKTTDYADYSD